MAYMDETFFHETVLPLVAREGSCLIGISTPLTAANFFTKLVTFKNDDGSLFFKTLHIELICKECQKKKDVKDMIQCPHSLHKLPTWRPKERQERLRIITEHFGDPNMGARELYGQITDDFASVLPVDEISAVFSEDPKIASQFLITENPTFILIAIDPNYGGQSETAMISGYFISEKHNTETFTGVIVGIDAKSFKQNDHTGQELFIINHVIKLRERYKTQKLIVVPENNTGMFGSRVVGILRKIGNCEVLHQNGGQNPGVFKTEAITEGYVSAIQDAFNTGAVKFDERWWTLTKRPPKIGKGSKSETDYIRSILKDELERFCYDEKGKLTGKINGYNDDKAIAFLMFFYWGRAILSSEPGNKYLNLLPREAIVKFISKQSLTHQGLSSMLTRTNNTNLLDDYL